MLFPPTNFRGNSLEGSIICKMKDFSMYSKGKSCYLWPTIWWLILPNTRRAKQPQTGQTYAWFTQLMDVKMSFYPQLHILVKIIDMCCVDGTYYFFVCVCQKLKQHGYITKGKSLKLQSNCWEFSNKDKSLKLESDWLKTCRQG